MRRTPCTMCPTSLGYRPVCRWCGDTGWWAERTVAPEGSDETVRAAYRLFAAMEADCR